MLRGQGKFKEREAVFTIGLIHFSFRCLFLCVELRLMPDHGSHSSPSSVASSAVSSSSTTSPTSTTTSTSVVNSTRSGWALSEQV
jgi:hypothetical protein